MQGGLMSKISSLFSRFWRILVKVGPAFYLIGYCIGTGSVVSMASAGSRYGMSLLWALFLSCLFSFIMMEAFGRYTFVSGKSSLSSFREFRFCGKPIAIATLLGSIFVEIMSLIGIVGIVSDLINEWIKMFMFEKGWTGRNVLLMNVLDREQMEWHKENKHSMLISRNIGVGKDGTEFPEVGVPSYGFSGALGNLFKFYGSWEKYDIGITRTGLKEAPYRVINATKYIEETGDKSDLVLEAPLTDEERAYEQYDLGKLFQLTNYTKIYNHLKGKIARIDATLNTKFLDDLKFLVDKEKKERVEKQTEAKQAEVNGETTTTVTRQ